MRFRKKPLVIEAFQLERRQLNWPQWANDALSENKIISHNSGKFHNPNEETFLIIKTPDGDHKASLGDWIIKGIANEIYHCKPDIFEATYEQVID